MAVQKTLAEVARAVLYEAAIVTGSGTQKRHPIEDLYPEINSAYVEMQEESIARKVGFFAVEGAYAPLPTDRAEDGANYSLVDWPAATHAIARVDVLLSCGDFKRLEPIDWENLFEVIPSKRNQTCRQPTHYSARQFASVSGATVTAGKIAIAPFCTGGSYRLSTLPEWTPITDTTHVFLFPTESSFRWVVYNMVKRIACRDPKAAPRFAIATQEQGAAESRMGRSNTVQQGTTMRRARRRWG